MRLILTVYLFFYFTQILWTQNALPVTNSFADHYEKNNPSVRYRFDTVRQIHDYSENWDFDQDGVLDQLHFVGIRGAHQYFFLSIVTSSNGKQHDLPFIVSDFPILPADSVLKSSRHRPTAKTFFTVFDMDLDNKPDIFVRLDEQTISVNKRQLRKKSLKTNMIVITYSHGQMHLRDFAD